MANNNWSKTGDWKAVQKIINNLPKDMGDAAKEGIKLSTLKGERIAKLHLKNQDLNWRELSSNTISNKAKNKQSNKTLIATSDYMQSITSVAVGYIGFVGVKKSARNRGGEPITMIAAVHEFGVRSLNIPARPLWKPSLDELYYWMKVNNPFLKITQEKLKNRGR
jgi:hypothetical protein